jgi:hypothetical protein
MRKVYGEWLPLRQVMRVTGRNGYWIMRQALSGRIAARVSGERLRFSAADVERFRGDGDEAGSPAVVATA